MIDTTPYDPDPVIDPSVGFESYNNVEVALNFLPEQFKDKPYVSAVIETYTSGVQDVENLLSDILVNSELGSAIGVQLDVLGRLFGEDRSGKDDDEYRAAIAARISIRSSQGTPDEILSITKTLAGSDTANIHEHFPAEYAVSVVVTADDTLLSIPTSIAENLKTATAAGVGPVTVELYLDTNALLGELSVVADGIQFIDSGGVLFDWVDNEGDFIQYQNIDPASDIGGFGVLAEISYEITPTTGVLAEIIRSGD
jgi:hypothetical protein